MILFRLKRLAIVLIFLVIPQTEFQANADDRNPTCKVGAIHSFKVNGLRRFTDEGQDYCLIPESKIDPILAASMAQIGRIHQEAATLLQVPLSTIFPNGIDIALVGDELGSLGYGQGKNSITVTSFKEGSGELAPSNYAHELGHFIAASMVYSPNVRKLLDTPGLREAFPDLLASSLTGRSSWPSDLPDCFGKAMRGSTAGAGLLSIQDFFSTGYSPRMMAKCCKQVEQYLPLQQQNTRAICSELKTKMSRYLRQPKDSATFIPAKCFNFRDGSFDSDRCDVHQLGIPISEFFQALAQRLEKDSVLGILYTQLRELKAQTDRNIFSCSLATHKDAEDEFEVEEVRLTVGQLFQRIKAAFPEPSQVEFDRLWKEMGMEKVLVGDQLELSFRAQFDAYQLFRDKRLPTKYRERNSNCGNRVLPYLNSAFPECELSCKFLRSKPEMLKFSIVRR